VSEDHPLRKLSQPEIASLIVLMATARELTNPELRELAGFDLTGAGRRRLNDLGLVASHRTGRQPFVHELTAEGWHAAREVLTSGRPARAGSFGGALYALMAALGAGLDRQGLSPAVFFGSPAVRRAQTQSPAAKTGERAGERAAPTADLDDLESAIRKAYSDLAERDGDWVGLAPLRTRLGGFDRTDVDEALRRLAMEPRVHIIPVANLKSLTQQDRDAALRLGGEDNHAIAIETR
jgi:hypothetical protein